MNILARFQAMDENGKAALVRKLMESSTPDFDFFYLGGLAVFMATLGMLSNNAAIVIGSMLISPILYPILGVSLGLVMSSSTVVGRSLFTLGKSLVIGVVIAAGATAIFGSAGDNITSEVLIRTTPDLLNFFVAVIAGLGVSFALGNKEWSDALPGVAISVALIPPLAVVGIGLAEFNLEIISGSIVLLLVNLLGIVLAALVSFSMMDLYQKKDIASSTIKREEERLEKEEEAIAEVIASEKGRQNISDEAK